ncbi:Serine/threonine kinase PKN8 [Minicystis rosea]|nr:Serine/threonine kinase PKN8 [Minicystis rosea]
MSAEDEGSARPDPRRVEELFDAVIDLDPELAPQRLAELAGGDVVLRDAVARLLAHDRAAAGFLARPAALLAEALADTLLDTAGPVAAETPARVGRFYLLRKLGEGGMGVVHVGYDEALDRKVALKLLHRGAATRDWLLREGQALGRLAHPNVVAVHEIGEHEGRVFLAMELVDGLTLRAWLAERAPSFREVIGMFLQAGRGLAAAHAAGLVHRDFKPDNVLVGKDGRARVVDFGIAGLADAAPLSARAGPTSAPADRPSVSPSALSSPLTETGAFMGTPAYMAPEQIRGERATAASDQFAFCVALWRAAYGAPPFPTDDLHALLRAASEDTPVPPRRTDAPAWLAPILLRGLAKDAGARFPSMNALLAEIGRRVPRDADHDPALALRERRILAGVMFLGSLTIWTFVFMRGAGHASLSPGDIVRIAVGLVSAALVSITLLRRRIAANQHGRRTAGLVLASVLALLAHRLVAFRLGTPVPHVLVVDAVLLATVAGVAAMTLERWFGWPCALALAGAAVGAYEPAWAIQAFAVTGFGITTTMLAMWGRRG